MARVSCALLFIVLILLASMTPHAFCVEYKSQSLNVNIYSDGSSEVVYIVEVDPTLARVSLPLIGLTFNDLLVVNENGILLVASESGSVVTVDSLGSSRLTFTYSTPELTTKIGILWTFNVTSPTNLVVVMPSGSTIVSMSQIPLEVKTIDERTRITLPSGNDSISYVISFTGAKEQADTLIKDAETVINSVKLKQVITTDADKLLTQAKTALATGEYLSSQQFAEQAKTSALDVEHKAQAADSAIELATTTIQTAKNEGRLSTIATAEESLVDAEDYYSSGKYAEAKTSADEAFNLGNASQKLIDNTPLIIGGLVAFTAVATGLFIYLKRQKEPPASKIPVPKVPTKGVDDWSINLESIFRKHQDLRQDDKDVIKYLAEHNGETFASEIRDRFNIPSTSAWRMIRRLIDIGIIEERKVGGQSLICIVKKYREVKE